MKNSFWRSFALNQRFDKGEKIRRKNKEKK